MLSNPKPRSDVADRVSGFSLDLNYGHPKRSAICSGRLAKWATVLEIVVAFMRRRRLIAVLRRVAIR